MKIRETIYRFASNIQTWSVRKIVSAIGVLIVVMYVLFFVAPRPVTFSYSENSTCINQPVFFPDIQRTDSTSFSVDYGKGLSIGSLRLVTTKLCLAPVATPSEGVSSVAIAPWGWYAFRSNYKITVPEHPKVFASKTKMPIASTKSIAYTTSKPDKTFSYILSSGEKRSRCSSDNSTISCNLASLSLAQGADHVVILLRTFKDNAKEIEVMKNTISILPAITVTSSNPKHGQTIYDKPTDFSFTTNKPLSSAKATIVRLEGDKAVNVDAKTSIKGSVVSVSLSSELEREKRFRLSLVSAEAVDGSTITDPYTVDFSTSGGPKVTAVSIGGSGVDPNERIVVTFDQPIVGTANIRQFVHITGLEATVTHQGSQIIFSLSNAPRCASFVLTIEKGVVSSVNNMPSKETWHHSSRITCRVVSTIGHSVKGRPITAYFYGNGPTAILFTGGMHGSEPSGYSTMSAWTNHLDSNAQNIPANKQVVVVPNTNPDGIATGSRYNANKVNIARNFATSDWKADIDTTTGVLAGGGGSAPMSEPETQALASLTLRLNPRLEVSYHASGRLVGANDWADSRAIGNLYASTVGYGTMFGGSAEQIMGYGFSGQYEDYIGQKLGKPAILIELPTASGNYINSQLSALWKIVNI